MKWLYILLLLFVYSCGKKDEVAPVISISSPTENQVFPPGQIVTIRATITDNDGVHMVHVIAVDNTGGHWVHSEDHVDGKTYEVTKTFITNPGSTYTITIDAEDHDENIATKMVTVSSN